MQQKASSIKNILEAVVSKMSGEKKDKAEQLRIAWEAVVTKEMGRHSKVANFKSKRLIVNVDSSAWMYEINLHKQQIKTDLNKNLAGRNINDEAVKEIILRVGEIR